MLTPRKNAKNYLKQRIANSQTLTDNEEFTTKEERNLGETLESCNLIEKIATINIFNEIKSIYDQYLKNS